MLPNKHLRSLSASRPVLPCKIGRVPEWAARSLWLLSRTLNCPSCSVSLAKCYRAHFGACDATKDKTRVGLDMIQISEAQGTAALLCKGEIFYQLILGAVARGDHKEAAWLQQLCHFPLILLPAAQVSH